MLITGCLTYPIGTFFRLLSEYPQHGTAEEAATTLLGTARLTSFTHFHFYGCSSSSIDCKNADANRLHTAGEDDGAPAIAEEEDDIEEAACARGSQLVPIPPPPPLPPPPIPPLASPPPHPPNVSASFDESDVADINAEDTAMDAELGTPADIAPLGADGLIPLASLVQPLIPAVPHN